MLTAGVLASEPDASPERLEHLLSANLCRCTGYKPILRAAAAAQQEIGGR
jgi:carbon-monoxide dehydrogenase small subunit